MQSVSSRIWTCVAVSISYDDNHYTTGTSTLEPFNFAQIKLLVFDSNTWNHLTMRKQISSGSFQKCYLQTIHLQIIHI